MIRQYKIDTPIKKLEDLYKEVSSDLCYIRTAAKQPQPYLPERMQIETFAELRKPEYLGTPLYDFPYFANPTFGLFYDLESKNFKVRYLDSRRDEPSVSVLKNQLSAAPHMLSWTGSSIEGAEYLIPRIDFSIRELDPKHRIPTEVFGLSEAFFYGQVKENVNILLSDYVEQYKNYKNNSVKFPHHLFYFLPEEIQKMNGTAHLDYFRSNPEGFKRICNDTWSRVELLNFQVRNSVLNICRNTVKKSKKND